MHYVGEMLEHVHCDDLERPEDKPDNPVCPRCWITHAGECF